MFKDTGAIDLFCGAGGMTYGLASAGIPVRAGIDLDATCAYPFEANNDAEFICADVCRLKASSLRALFRGAAAKILVGCAPCQTFSSHTQKDRSRHRDVKWELILPFCELATALKPEVVSMENVPQVAKFSVFRRFVKGLENVGYHVSWSIVRCADYDTPQTRKRLVLLASRLGPISLIDATRPRHRWRTVEDAIGHLEPIASGEVSAKDPLHRCSALTDVNFRRIRSSKPGGSWRDWNKELRTSCHKKEEGRRYSGVYARMSWDQLSPTITTQFYTYGTGRFGHPEQDRAISVREGALLQTFPRSYDFINPDIPFSFRRVSTYIGNAVPVGLATAIGKSIRAHLSEH